jgi:hypothetical protein
MKTESRMLNEVSVSGRVDAKGLVTCCLSLASLSRLSLSLSRLSLSLSLSQVKGGLKLARAMARGKSLAGSNQSIAPAVGNAVGR